jgi:diacylglycerol O-acyltransferase / wax synthase
VNFAREAAVIDRLSAEDARILKLERRAVRGHTCKVIVLERFGDRPLPTFEAIRTNVEARLDAARRLRQRVVPTPLRVAGPVWLDDPQFDIRRHVTQVPADGRTLEETVAALMSQRLERDRPLWHLGVEELVEHDQLALIWRVHHCLADGTTCMRLASTVLWDDSVDHVPLARVVWSPDRSPSALKLFAQGVGTRAGTAANRLRLVRPRLHSLPVTESVAGRELRRGASKTSLAGRFDSEREVAFAQAPLEACRQAGKAIAEGVTVNDVVLAIITGAVRTWLGPENAIRVKVPVSLHQGGEGENLANRDSFFFVDLPVDKADPIDRVLAINRETDERKLEHDADVLYRLGAHPFVARWAMSPRVFTFNVSNVHGPTQDVFILGARVRQVYSLAEISRHHALRVAVVSAAGSLFFGLCAARHAVKDLQGLADALQRASEELLALAA